MKLTPMTVTVFFPSDMEVGEDRARWYLDHAIRGYWQSFATDTDPIRNMRRCSVSIKPLTEAGRRALAEGVRG